VVQRWTGRETRLLRHSLRLTVREFAEDLGVDPRTVTKWESGGAGRQPRPELQRALDTVLHRAGDGERRRFLEARQDAPSLHSSGPAAAEPSSRYWHPTSEVMGGDLGLTEVLRRAAHDSAALSAAAEADARTGRLESVGHARADLRRLTADYFTRSDIACVVAEATLLGARLKALWNDRSVRADAMRDVHLVIGANCLLMATISHDVRQPDVGMTHVRAAQVHARLAGQPELLGWALGTAATIELWRGRPGEALSYADRGGRLALGGEVALRLLGLRVRALARLGRDQEARQLQKVEEGLSPEWAGGCMADYGMLFMFPGTRRQYYAAATHAQLGQHDAVERSVAAMGNPDHPPASDSWPVSWALGRSYLALSRLGDPRSGGGPEGARQALAPLLLLPAGQCIDQVRQVLTDVERGLTGLPLRGSAGSGELVDLLREFRSRSRPRGGL
jgi:transcriptional regulator with XRE-family HTH domain